MIGQGATQTSPSPGLHPSARASGDVNITALACAPYDSILSAPLPTSSNPSDHRRPTAAKAPHPNEVLKCPRCDSLETKFCYYNNYSLTQPRYFCKNCKRYWTAGGALRNVPVGGGLRKNKRSKLKLAAAAAADAEAAALAAQTLAGGGQPQSQGKATGEVPNKVDNRATVAHGNNAMPAHLVVGVPELGVYVQSGGMSTSKRHVVEDPPHYSVEHTADRNDTHMASAPTLPQQAASLYVKDEGNATAAGPATFFCDPAQVPQFYSSYAASLPIQYGNAAVPGGAVPGYAVNYNFFTPGPNGNPSNEECGNASASASVPGPVMAKQEKDATDGSGNAYDWQLISEGLFNGSGANDGNFFYAPSASWPDFSQFNDNGPR